MKNPTIFTFKIIYFILIDMNSVLCSFYTTYSGQLNDRNKTKKINDISSTIKCLNTIFIIQTLNYY